MSQIPTHTSFDRPADSRHRRPLSRRPATAARYGTRARSRGTRRGLFLRDGSSGDARAGRLISSITRNGSSHRPKNGRCATTSASRLRIGATCPRVKRCSRPASATRKRRSDTGRDLPLHDPDVEAGTPMLGPNQWPDQPGFSEAVTAYYDAAFRAGARAVSRLLARARFAGDAFRCVPDEAAEPAAARPITRSTQRPRTRPASARIPTTNASPSCCRPRPDWK